MPTIRKAFLFKCLLAFLLVAGLLAGVHAFQSRRIPEALQRQAERALAQSKPDAAARYLRQYLEFRPADIDAHEQLAEILRARSGEQARGDLVFLYDRILRADPERHGTRREALKLDLRYGRYADALANARALTERFPAEAELWQLRAQACAGLRQYPEAVRCYARAIAATPRDTMPYQRLAQLQARELQSPADAKATLDRLVLAMPHDAEAYLARARFAATGPLPPFASDGVLQDLSMALERKPHDPDLLQAKAERLLKHRKTTAAHECLSEGLRRHPGAVSLIRTMAWLETQRGNVGAAISTLEDGIASAKDPSELLVPWADLLMRRGDLAQAEEAAAKLERRATPSAKLQAQYLRARLAMAAERWADAVAKLTALRASAGALPAVESQANALLAQCYRATADDEAERDCLVRILTKEAVNSEARVALAQLGIRQGKTADAVREYEVAARLPDAGPLLIDASFRLKLARSSAGGNPQTGYVELERDLVASLPRFGGAAETVLLRAEIVAAGGNPTRAAELLGQEVAKRPGDVRLRAAYAEAVGVAAGTLAGLQVLDEAPGDGPELRLARASLYARDPANLFDPVALEARTEQWPEAEAQTLLAGLIEVHARLGDDAQVLRLYRKLAALRADDRSLWMAVYQRGAKQRDDAACGAAEAALARLGDDAGSAALRRAWKALATGLDRKAAEQTLCAAFGEKPTRAEACVALADLRANDSSAALYARAVQLAPHRFEAVAGWLDFTVKHDAANLPRVLARLAADPLWYGEPFRRAVRSTSNIAALTAARQIVEAQPDGLGWLADVYAELGHAEESLAAAEAAVRKSTATPDDFVRLALRRNDVVTSAETRLTPTAYVRFAAALAESKQGKTFSPTLKDEHRVPFVRARLAIRLAKFERTEAVALVDEFLRSSELAATERDWATRNLAMLLVVRGSAADRQRAVTLTYTSDTTDDRRATAAALAGMARYLDGPERESVLARAAAMMEAVARDGTPQDRFTLTNYYRTAGRRGDFRRQLNGLLAADPSNADYLLAALDELLEANELEDAQPFVERLKALAPSDVRAVMAAARWECLAGRPADAVARVEAYIRVDEAAHLARGAGILAELATLPGIRGTPAARPFVDGAIAKYETLGAGQPDVVLAAAGLLGNDGRCAEGFASIEKYARTLSPRRKVAAGLAALRGGGGGPKLFETFRTWLAAARAEDPDSLAMRLSEAEFAALRHDYAAAEALYEGILNDDPRSVIALNNLAWILAPRAEASSRAAELIARAVRETGVTPELLDTRARVRIAAKQFAPAEADLAEALRQGKTPLRLFHYALAKQGQNPPQREEAERAFREARRRGLDANAVHPDDLPQFRAFGGPGG